MLRQMSIAKPIGFWFASRCENGIDESRYPMVMVPVSLTFLSVPVSSSASACAAQKVAAIARPIIRRRFIRLSLAWIIAVQPTAIKAWIAPQQRNRMSAWYAIGPSTHAMAGPLHGRRRNYLQELFVGIRVG